MIEAKIEIPPIASGSRISPWSTLAEVRGQKHHRDRGDRVGLEQVGRHAGAVADVVTDVVGDDRRVARIVLGDTGLDLADQVGADVGGLGEDAAAESREDRDQRASEGQTDQMVDGLCLRDVEARGEDPVVAGDAEQAETDHEQARHRAGTEGDLEGRPEPVLGRLGGADIRAHRDVHADESSGRRKHCADEEADCRSPTELVVEADQQKRDHRDDGDRRVLLA